MHIRGIRDILDNIVKHSENTTEKGKRFENLIKIFLENDKTFSPQFSEVLTYAEWAGERGEPQRDIGIDLVAKNAHNDYYSAIQCKFYDSKKSITKAELDSFIAASERAIFDRRLFVDTTSKGISANALEVIRRAPKEFTRIGLDDLEKSSINWELYLKTGNNKIEQKAPKQIFPHQEKALNAVMAGLEQADRGKMIMACGTGKTFTALKIAEAMAGKGKNILFLAPSLALVDQSVREWTQQSEVNLYSCAVCSDTHIGKNKQLMDIVVEEDSASLGRQKHDLAFPATTRADKLAEKYKKCGADNMGVIFATYHSIDVIAQAQKKHNLPEFDLIICDEAHRTTGHTHDEGEESPFVKVHNQANIKGKKRLYMTATPRIYSEKAKSQATYKGVGVWSMDEESLYGKELYVMKFGEAVHEKLLSDYKVLILTVQEEEIAADLQELFANHEGLTIDNAGKIIGCYKALAKMGVEETEGTTTMKKAVMFCETIAASKNYENLFEKVIEKHKVQYSKNLQQRNFNCEVVHIDGTMNSAQRSEKIHWLEEASEENGRILSNARCLSEGVDIPTLDAIMFMNTKKSKVDIVQSVGRIMRKAEGKKLGYVVLPIVLPSKSNDKEIEEELDKNKVYEVIWDVLNALRSHDERLDADINKIGMGVLPSKIEVIDVVNKLGEKGTGEWSERPPRPPEQPKLVFEVVQDAILAKIVKLCGTRKYLKQWVDSVADVSRKEIVRIASLLKDENSEAYKQFEEFLNQLRKNINNSVQKDEAVEMLAQHIITKPIFDSLFKDYNFSDNNAVSKAMQKMVNVLQDNNLESETKSLAVFYKSIQRRIEGIESDEHKQKIIVELYDDFFKKAFPKMAERLGIVYTPVECVDFIIHSVNDVLQQEFGKSIGDKETHIIDPFTGTGTFITRLIQSGLIDSKQLPHKYKKELHANEIILLAYYMASINIESAYHGVMQQAKKNKGYHPFEGICLTDTFQLYEDEEDLLTPQFPDNSKRITKQKELPLRVIIGNPPYSAGQKSGNDNNPNLIYKKLDSSIAKNYIQESLHKGNKNSLYDSYIRAIRWATDRIVDDGIIGFITNGGWIDGNAMDGLRSTLAKEFSSIYIFHLRGNQRTSGELSKKEGGKIFGGGSRAPIAITILVKKTNATEQGKIYYHDIGDYLNREQKLKKIADYKSIDGITQQKAWQSMVPNEYYDWINPRDDSFYTHIAMGNKKDKTIPAIFSNYSNGLKTNRDAWVYNVSKTKLEQNVKRTIAYYNDELNRYNESEVRENQPDTKNEAEKYIAQHLNNDSTQIAFSRDFRYDIFSSEVKQYQNKITKVLYRPFSVSNTYYCENLMTELYQMPKIFPEAGLDNLMIGVSGRGSNSFSCLISDTLPDLEFVSKSQCFPFKLYEAVKEEDGEFAFNKKTDSIVTANSGKQYIARDAITDEGLKHFTDKYKTTDISRKDLFYYIYGLLHSPDYRQRYASNLTKDLPHIPRVKSLQDFKLLAKAGKELADCHLYYEDEEQYPYIRYKGEGQLLQQYSDEDYYVKKMKFLKKKMPTSKKGKKSDSVVDKTVIIYNDKITITHIPLEAYDYVVNGKPAIEWVMERQGISTHKDSGITNNANDWAHETMNNPRYPLELLLKIITVSIKSVEIIKSLPKLDI